MTDYLLPGRKALWRKVGCLRSQKGVLSLILTSGFIFCSCTSLKNKSLSRSFDNITTALYTQSDPELVRRAFPTLLILADTLIQSDPTNSSLLYAGTSAYTAYSYLFLYNQDGTEEHSKKTFATAKKYGFRLLDQEKLFSPSDSLDEVERQLAKTTVQDVPHLYAVSSAWLGWILSHSDSMEALADLGKALSVMQRILELDESYDHGKVHVMFGIYYAIRPRGIGQDLEKSKAHFTKAIAMDKGDNLLAMVAYAQYYARATLDQSLFSDILNRVLTSDKLSKNIRLLDEIARQRAQYLLENQEELF